MPGFGPTKVNLKLLLFLANFIVIALSIAGCSTHRVKERISYWESETGRYLPQGSTLQQAEEFFSSRGSKLMCCMRSPPQIPEAHYVLERKIGYALWMEYDVAVLVIVSDDQRVQSVKVQRWGVGL